MTKKVLFVATVVKKHINVFHLPYLEWFKQQGYETHVCARNDFEGEKCNIPNCDIYHEIPFDRKPFSGDNIISFLLLKEVIDKNNYDIIHCHTPVAGILTRLAAVKSRANGTKVIYTAHGFHFYKGAPVRNWLIYFPSELICSLFTDKLITINKEDYNLSKKWMRAKEIYKINGVGVNTRLAANDDFCRVKYRQQLGVPIDSYLLVSVGELSTRKNHKVVIDALEKLNDKKIYYIICGQGPMHDDLRSQANENKLKDNIIFLGYRKDIFEICRTADIFIFPSLQEGLPVALIEAMSVGLPCIVSDIRGNSDLIEDSIGGYKFDPKDENLLSELINRLIEDPATMYKMGKYNHESIIKYDISEIRESLIKVYEG